MFTSKTLSFLRSLKRNNQREWFHERRDQYELHCRQPMTAVIERLADDLRSFAPELIAEPTHAPPAGMGEEQFMGSLHHRRCAVGGAYEGH